MKTILSRSEALADVIAAAAAEKAAAEKAAAEKAASEGEVTP